jgi:hypothetical protein
MSDDKLPAISLWQPWASLVVADRKQYETRSWRCPANLIGRRVAIHAAQKRVPLRLVSEECNDVCCDEFGCSWNYSLPYGGVIGTARVVGCSATTDLNPAAEERAVGDWSPGRFAWELAEIENFNGSYPAKGLRRIWYWTQPAPKEQT